MHDLVEIEASNKVPLGWILYLDTALGYKAGSNELAKERTTRSASAQPTNMPCNKAWGCTVALGSPLSGQSGAGEGREGVKAMQVRETVGILRSSQTPKRMEYLARWRITGGLKMGFSSMRLGLLKNSQLTG